MLQLRQALTSKLMATSRFISGIQSTLYTSLVCPIRVSNSCPLVPSHTFDTPVMSGAKNREIEQRLHREPLAIGVEEIVALLMRRGNEPPTGPLPPLWACSLAA